MDRKIIYPGQIPMVEDQLLAARFTQIGIGRLAGALYDESGTGASGFTCAPGSGLSVTISPGQISQPGVVDASAFGVLPASASALPRQYVLADPVNIGIPGTGATYIIYGTVGTADTANAVLPYYNSANPSQTFAGAGNGGQNQPTVRTDNVTIGIATSVPSGSIPLWAVTVPNGATSITSAMISAASGAPLYPSLRGLAARAVAPFNAALAAAFGGYPSKTIVADPTTTGLFWVSTADNNLTTPGVSGALWTLFSNLIPGCFIGTRVITASGTYTPTPGTRRIRVRLVGGGGAGGGTYATGSSEIAAGWGGLAGIYAESSIITSGFSGISMVIGAPGAAAVGAYGGNGGATSFGSFLSAPGGSGGKVGTNNPSPASAGGYTQPSGAASGSALLRQRYGSCGGGPIVTSNTTGMGGCGADSEFGRGGAAGYLQISPSAGTGYGSGGASLASGNSQPAWAGGWGAPGLILIDEYT